MQEDDDENVKIYDLSEKEIIKQPSPKFSKQNTLKKNKLDDLPEEKEDSTIRTPRREERQVTPPIKEYNVREERKASVPRLNLSKEKLKQKIIKKPEEEKKKVVSDPPTIKTNPKIDKPKPIEG